MIISEFECRSCHALFELVRSLKEDESLPHCPRCRSNAVLRVATLAASCSGGEGNHKGRRP